MVPRVPADVIDALQWMLGALAIGLRGEGRAAAEYVGLPRHILQGLQKAH